jgi:hypothetical protein
MDEGRKRVVAIIAGILVARQFKTPEDLFGRLESVFLRFRRRLYQLSRI